MLPLGATHESEIGHPDRYIREMSCRCDAGTGLILSFSETFRECFASTREALLQATFMSLVGAEFATSVSEIFGNISVNCAPAVCEGAVTLNGGPEVRHRWHFFPVVVKDGAVREIGGIGFNLTEMSRTQHLLMERWDLDQVSFVQELHDSVRPSFSGARFQAEYLSSLLSDPEHVEAAHSLVHYLNQAEMACRSITIYMRDVSSPRRKLRDSLEAFCSLNQNTYGVLVALSFSMEMSSLLTDQFSNHVLRIIQEAVRNAIRHAQPTSIAVDVSLDGQFLQVEVLNDGKSIEAAALNGSAGLGLHLMRLRANAIAGILRIEPLAEGTRVSLRAPLPSSAVIENA